jgi:hypothetical protein
MKKPKLDKPPKEPKAPKAAKVAAGSNTLDPEMRALFIADKEKYAKAMERQKKISADVREITKMIKEDGFSLRQIKLAIQLETPEGEAEFRSLIANDLLAAQYAGAAIGSQLQLFLDDKDRTPLVDRAFDEGVQDAMANKPAKPSYDLGTEPHMRYLDGFHSVTEQTIKAGIKPLSGAPPRASDMN